jgi:hypothetical protein
LPRTWCAADLGKLLLAIEQRQDALIRAKLQPSRETTGSTALSPAEQQDAALTLLQVDPDLIARIVADVEATGVVGEASNALVAYLACVSTQARQAARDPDPVDLVRPARATLMDAVLALMPEAERVQYSAMTGQSLFYLGETSHEAQGAGDRRGGGRAAGRVCAEGAAVARVNSRSHRRARTRLTGELVTKTYTGRGAGDAVPDDHGDRHRRGIVEPVPGAERSTRAASRRRRSSSETAGRADAVGPARADARSSEVLDDASRGAIACCGRWPW